MRIQVLLWTLVYRHNNSTVASVAASWAASTYLFSGATYSITPDLASTDSTYCSKLVWQAYAFGPSPSESNYNGTIGIVIPFELPNFIKSLSPVYAYFSNN